MELQPEYVAALDVGTTTIRCQIINSQTETVGSARCETKLIYPQTGHVEINPTDLWESIISVIKNGLANAKLTAKNIKCLGISTQRGSFITWRIDSGEPLHNFIVWKDLRAKQLVNELNSSILLKTVRFLAYMVYLVTLNKRYLAGSKLKISPNHVTGRLLWAISNIPPLKNAILQNNAMFGTLDSWLIYNFTNRKLHVTDITNASATAFYDPFTLDWGSWAIQFLGIPKSILPKVVPNDFNFGHIEESIFGAAIPITCVMADQSSAMFASCCFEKNDLKVTMGTGGFLNINSANNVPTSVTSMYPLVGWIIKNEIVYLGETACYDCGSLIQWLLNAILIQSPPETAQLAESVESSDGVYFIPAFSGLGPPIDDMEAASGFLGIKPTTTKSHMIRAVLESIVYRITLSYSMLKEESQAKFKKIVVDGGVSLNDFVCQLLADLTGLTVERLASCEMALLGAGFVAGLSCGVWESKEELVKLKKIGKRFEPTKDEKYVNKCKYELSRWLKAAKRFKSWYDDE